MNLKEKIERFYELRKLVKTEEQAAVLFCRMVYGNGFQALHDEIEDMDTDINNMSEDMDDDPEDVGSKIEDGLRYLEKLAKDKIASDIESAIKE